MWCKVINFTSWNSQNYPLQYLHFDRPPLIPNSKVGYIFYSELKDEFSFLNFRTTRNVPSLVRENLLGHNREDIECLHQILNFLFTLLPNAKHYTDLHTHATAKLVAYFQTMSHFLLGPTEKLLFEPHFQNLWQLFHPKLSEPAIPGIHF